MVGERASRCHRPQRPYRRDRHSSPCTDRGGRASSDREFSSRVPVRVREFDDRSIDEPAQLEIPASERAPPQGSLIEAVVQVRVPGVENQEFVRRTDLPQAPRDARRPACRPVPDHRPAETDCAASAIGSGRRCLARSLPGWRVSAKLSSGGSSWVRTRLSAGASDSFRASGLYHLLAVSGQNVAYVVMGVLLLAWLVGIPRLAGEVGSLGAVMGYVMAVGWQPSVVRAGVAGGLPHWPGSAGAPATGGTSSSSVRPSSSPGIRIRCSSRASSCRSPRWQPSSSSCRGWRHGSRATPFPRALFLCLTVSAACGAATAPILMIQFGKVPLYSVPSNALAAPVVAPLLGLALVCSVLHLVLPGCRGSRLPG